MPTKADEIEFAMSLRAMVDERWGNEFSYLADLLTEAVPMWVGCIREDRLGSPLGDLWDEKFRVSRQNDEARAVLETTRGQIREAEARLAMLARQTKALTGEVRKSLAAHNAVCSDLETACLTLVR